MAFRFLHLADLHLETSFGGRPETRERLRAATHQAFERAVDYAIEHRLHAVLAAGDLYDDPLLSLKTELALVSQVERLARAGVWFLACCGNHDPGAPHLRAAHLGIEAAPDAADGDDWRRRVHLFRRPAPEVVRVTDGDGHAVGIVVGAGHPTATEADDLAARFPAPDEPLPVVGLLHTHVASARAAEGHDRYAPSTAADYERLGAAYGYWALGHIHIRQRAVEGLPVFYAGNLQGRNPRETGEKGGYVVEVHAGAAAEPRFVPFAPVRWEHLTLDDLPDATAPAVLVEHIAGRVEALRAEASAELALRIELRGATPLARTLRDADERQQLEEELTARTGCLEVQLRTAGLSLPFDPTTLRESPTVVSRALDLIDAARSDPALLDSLAPEHLAANVPPGEERRAYLAELLSTLSDELIERSVVGDEA